MKIIDKIWKLLNSPLIVVIIALSIWPILSAFTMHQAISKLTTDTVGAVVGAFKSFDESESNEARSFMQIREDIEFTNIKYSFSDWKNKEKIIATVTNRHKKPVRHISVNISFYDQKNELIDVIDSYWVTGITILQPNESINFSYSRVLGNINEDDKILEKRKSHKAVITVSSLKEFE